MITALLSGLILGLTAGISPGPLLTLVISETLRHGKTAGIKVALAPMLTDGPMILASVLVLTRLSNANALLGIISLCGAAFVAYLGYESVRTTGITIDARSVGSRSLMKGTLVNFLSPHPYLFWMTVGGPMILQTYESSLGGALLFMGTFLGCLVGSKIVVALLVARSQTFLRGKTYVWLMRGLGVLLFAFAILFLQDAIVFFGKA